MVAGALNGISEQLMIAIWKQEEKQFLLAWREMSRASSTLFYFLSDYTVHKRIEEAAEAIGIPGLTDGIQTISHLKRTIQGFTQEYVRRLYEVEKAHWEYQLESVWQPLKEHLARQGVDDPIHIPVIGELILCYGGTRIYELGRAVMEYSFSLEWAKAELERGDTQEAFYKIGYEDVINTADEKWTRINDAITDAGYDTGTIVKDFLTSENFRERTEAARKAISSPDVIPVTDQHAHQLVTAVYECSRLLSEYWVSHYPDSFEAMPEVYTLSRTEIVQRCRKREAHIDNEFVSIIVCKQKAAIKSLVFKPGTNAELVESHWCDAVRRSRPLLFAYLLDLSSILQQDLCGKWMLEKEEVGANEAHFSFSQEGSYRVDLNIVWSETGVTATASFQLPQPIAINNNIAIGGQMSKARNDYWAMMIGGKVEVGNYAHKPGPMCIFTHLMGVTLLRKVAG